MKWLNPFKWKKSQQRYKYIEIDKIFIRVYEMTKSIEMERNLNRDTSILKLRNFLKVHIKTKSIEMEEISTEIQVYWNWENFYKSYKRNVES